MRAQLLSQGVRLVERVMVIELLTSDGYHPTQGRVVGALGIHTRNGQSVVFKAKAVVQATGTMGHKLHGCYADNLTGDGQAMAFRAGAEHLNLEFSFIPGFHGFVKGKLAILAIMPFQTQGAHIINSLGQRFMKNYMPERMERLSTFGLLALAWSKEVLERRGPVYFDMRHFTPRAFPPIEENPSSENGLL